MRHTKLTDIQSAHLKYICGHIKKKKRPPTVRDICAHFGLASTNGARTVTAILIRKGYLTKTDMVSRGLSVTKKGEKHSL